MTQSLVIQTSFLGDMVLTTPLIETLAERGPVDVVATPEAAGLLANNPHVRRVVVFDKRESHRGLRGTLSIAWEARSGGPYDAVYFAQGSLRSALLGWISTSRGERVGFDSSAGKWLYTRRVAYRDDLHHARRLLSLAVENAADRAVQPRLYPGDAEREVVTRLLADGGWRGEQLIALAPGSIWSTKRWPYYADLAAGLPGAVRPVVIGSAADAPLAAAIAERNVRTIDATGRLSLLASAELISRCAALITNDSAPLHLGSAVGTPTVAVFGPTVPAFGFGPLADRSAVVGHAGLRCRPCHRHGPRRCPLGHWRCMRELSIDDVLHHLTPLLTTAF